MLKICEIYTAIQGESSFVGEPCVIVRLAGCNLDCTWCDTPQKDEVAEELSLETIVARCREKPTLLEAAMLWPTTSNWIWAVFRPARPMSKLLKRVPKTRSDLGLYSTPCLVRARLVPIIGMDAGLLNTVPLRCPPQYMGVSWGRIYPMWETLAGLLLRLKEPNFYADK